jgi:hypothetical protein
LAEPGWGDIKKVINFRVRGYIRVGDRVKIMVRVRISVWITPIDYWLQRAERLER